MGEALTDAPREIPTVVVGVGCSVGDAADISRLISALPKRSGMAIILVHTAAPQDGRSPDLLGHDCGVPVVRLETATALLPDHIYVVPAGTPASVSPGSLQPHAAPERTHSPINDVFRSLARAYGARSAGIVLSFGAGGDGVAGLAEIRGVAGLTLLRAAVGAEEGRGADLILPIEGMPEVLERFAALSDTGPVPLAPPNDGVPPEAKPAVLTEGELDRLGALLGSRHGFDITIYKATGIERRVVRRMVLTASTSKEDYLALVEVDSGEQQRLLAELRSGVTSFFRDRGAFDVLKTDLVESLLETAEIRVWVPGCATGEEAYSLAILLLEEFKELRQTPRLQVFATDVDAASLAVARAGVYSDSAVAPVPGRLLSEYFIRLDDGRQQVRPRVRDFISFATHDLCKDPPFSRIDLVSYRSGLTHLKPAVEDLVLRALHFALQPGALLWLGPSETADLDAQLFEEVSKEWRIYRKSAATHILGTSGIVRRRRGSIPDAVAAGARLVRHEAEPLADGVRRALLQAHVPPAVVISREGRILYLHGDLRPYLRFSEGPPQRELWPLLGPQLEKRVRAASQQARRDGRVVKLHGSTRPEAGAPHDLQVSITPVPEAGEGALVIAFEPRAFPSIATTANTDLAASQQPVERMEQELLEVRQALRDTSAELETALEELRLSSEESSSIHEELQATNEELEATTEELRSLNQELTTVNTELKDKLAQLELANDDLSNFFSSTRLATVFLDTEGRIRRFTPAAHDLLGIHAADAGRLVTDLARELLQAELDRDVVLVLQDLAPKSRDLETSDQRWIVRQVLPYRTRDGGTAGVVVTFQDVTEFKRTEALLRKREAQQAVVSELGRKALETRQLGEYLDVAVQEVQRMLGTDRCWILELQPGSSRLLLRAGLGWEEGLVGRATVPAHGNLDPGAMFRTREPMLVDDLSAHPQLEPHDLLTKHGVRSCVSCVIHNERGAYGLIGAYHRTKGRFTTDDAVFLQSIANVVGSAVSAYQTDLRAQLEQATNRLLSEPGDVPAVSTRILLELGGALGADICELWRKEGSSDRLCCEFFETPSDPSKRDELRSRLVLEPIQQGMGLVGETWRDGRAHWRAIAGAGTERGRTLLSLGVTEGIAFPVVAAHQTIGVMAFFSRRHLSWDDQMLDMLNKVGQGIGAFVRGRRIAFEQAHLAAIVASSDDAILSKDSRGIVQSWNPGAERLYGYTAAEMVGTDVARLFPEHLKWEADSILERISNGEHIDSYETVRVRKDGSHIHVSVTVSPIRSDDGRVVGASAIGRDITERKRAEKRLAEADRQKDQFLAMLGHELRNPLAAVRNATELLKLQTNTDATTERIREVLDRQTRHMAHLMDGLLDVSRILRNKIDLKFEPVDMATIVRDVVDEYQARPERSPPRIHLTVEAGRTWVRGDSVRLTQIIDNLLGNAVKFTGRDGAIFLTLAERNDQVIFSVRDTGRGITPELLPHVFDVFRQAQQSLDRTSGGLGLGLALVKLLTELHGGGVEALSDGPERGAEFIVRIPAIPTPPKARTPLPAAAGKTLDILVVEDNRDAAELLCELLQLAGHATELAYSAEAAWERLQQRTPEVVLCDLGLPGAMTGFDLARRIRSDERLLRTRIIAVSGYGRPEDKVASRQAGFDAHLTKPVDFDALQSVLTQPSP